MQEKPQFIYAQGIKFFLNFFFEIFFVKIFLDFFLNWQERDVLLIRVPWLRQVGVTPPDL